MPVVELELPRLQKLIGKTNRKKILQTLPFLGLDIESQENDIVRVEYSPNRPDYSTDFGIAIGLQGLLGSKKGLEKLKIKKINDYKIKVDSSVSKVRPFVTGIIAKKWKNRRQSFESNHCNARRSSSWNRKKTKKIIYWYP